MFSSAIIRTLPFVHVADGIRTGFAGIRPGFGRDSAEMVESQILVVVAPVNVVVMEIRNRDEDQIVVVMGIES